jgi:hypothetical protein
MAKTNWGAGLRALGQGLAGLAEQQSMERERAMLRQQDLDDRAAQQKWLTGRDAENRAYEEALWNKRNPMVDLPSETVDYGGWGVGGDLASPQAIDVNIPNPNRPDWLPEGMSQIPQSAYLDLYGRNLSNQPAETPMSPYTFAPGTPGFGQQTVQVPTSGLPAMYNANMDALTPRGGSGGGGASPGITALKAMLDSQVSPQEVTLRGTGYKSAVQDRFYELASPVEMGGAGLGYNQATLNQAENEVLQSGQFGSLNFPGIVPGEEASNAVKYNPADGTFYDSRYYQPDSGERKGKGPDWLHKDTTPSSAMLGEIPNSLVDEATRAAPMSRGTYARQFILPYLKKGQPGYLDGDKAPELLAWAQQNGIDAETLAAIIREAQNTPNDPPAPGKYVPGSDLFPASADVDAVLGGGL